MKPPILTTFLLCFLHLAFSASSYAQDPLNIVSLNPIVTDLVKQVGGDHVTVVSLVAAGADPHAYRPTPSDFKLMQSADLIVAAGKGMENYLTDIRSSIPGVELIEVSHVLPGIRFHSNDILLTDHADHAHNHGHSDPHWWHSTREVRRVTRFLHQVLKTKLPNESDLLTENYHQFRHRLESLDQWAEQTLSSIPTDQRILATAHAAFNYFCRDYSFAVVPIRGLNSAQTATPTHLREVIDLIRDRNIPVVFPEANSNPSVLSALVKESGVRLGPPLLADYDGPGRSWI